MSTNSLFQNELTYINNIMPSGNSQLTALNTTLGDVNTNLTTLDSVQKNAISHQNDIKNIITDETTRLNDKKTTIDNAIISQNRIIYFNDNSRKIYAAYLRILIVFTLILAIIWSVTVIKSYIIFIPSWIFDIIYVLTFCIGIIIVYNYYIDILRRNRYNFDELNSAPPTTNTTSNDSATSSSKGDLMAGITNICIGEDCCNPRPAGVASSSADMYTTWDNNTNKCVKEGFAAISQPREEYEYAYYSPYK